MADFKVQYAALNNAESRLKSIDNKLSAYSDKINSIANNISFKINAGTAMKSKLRTISNDANKLAQKADSMSSAVRNIFDIYMKTESSIKKVDTKSVLFATKDKKKSAENTYQIDFDWKQLIGGGIIANTVKNIIEIYDAVKSRDGFKIAKSIRSNWKNIVNIKDTIKKMGKAKRIMNPSEYKHSWLNKLLGKTDYYKDIKTTASKASHASTRFYNNFSKSWLRGMSKIGWLDVAISGITSAISNYGEYKEGKINQERAIAETISETGVSLATNVLITAGTAAAIATGAGGAPAIAVCITAGLVKMGLDSVAKWATNGEKDFTEIASDAILDIGTAAAQRVTQGAEKIKDIGKTAISSIKSITTGWKTCFGY